MRVDPRHDGRAGVLRFEREGAVDAQHQRRRRARFVGIALGAARRPLQLDRPCIGGDLRADDLRPMGDEARLAKSARGERRANEIAEKCAERRGGSAGFSHGASATSVWDMSDRLDRRGPALKPQDISRAALAWWDVNRRDLPWRAPAGEPAEPYRVWLSEILLQQTTAVGAAPYFQDFLARWPTLKALAAAPLEDVMQAFAGLGYYSRARNLHACAHEVAARGGTFPSDEAALRAIAGRRPLYRGRDRGDRLRSAGRAGRRQYRPHSVATERFRDADSPATERP